MTIGESIKIERKKAGLTQKELGQKIGVTYQTVAQWENGYRNPKIETVEKLANALGIELAIFIGRSADVAPVVHGKWIEDDYGFNHCSECGYEWDESEYATEYCPGCGAKMSLEDDNGKSKNDRGV